MFFSGHVPRSFDRVLGESWAGDEEVQFIYVILCELKHRKQGLWVEQQQSCRLVCSEAKSCESGRLWIRLNKKIPEKPLFPLHLLLAPQETWSKSRYLEKLQKKDDSSVQENETLGETFSTCTNTHKSFASVMWYVHHGKWIQALTHTKCPLLLLLFYWIILHDHLLHMLSTCSGSILSYYKWESCPLSCIYFQLVQDQSVLSYYYKWGSYVVFLASILNVGNSLDDEIRS